MNGAEEPPRPDAGAAPTTGDGRPTLLVVDDHLLLAESVASALTTSGAFDVVGIAGSLAAAAAHLAKRPAPDLALVDMRLPDGRGTDLAALARDLRAGTKIVLMTGVPEPDLLQTALAAGCHGVVLKEERSEVLVSVLTTVARGEVAVGPRLFSDVISAMTAPPPPGALTPRERQVLEFLVNGLKTPVIAERLGVAETTARNHIQAVLRRLGASTRGEAVAIALREGLVAPPTDGGTRPP